MKRQIPVRLVTPRRRKKSKFETHREALLRRKKLRGRLKRAGIIEAKNLNRKLRRCREKQRCGSDACPVCARVFRCRLEQQVIAAVDPTAEILSISLIPEASRFEVGTLHQLDLKKWGTSRQRSLVRALPKEAKVVAGIDISLNTLANGDPHWCLHLFGYIVLPAGWGVHKRRKRDALRASIKAHCPVANPPPDNPGQRPLLLGVRSADEMQEQFLYAHKSVFSWRSSYFYVRKRTGKLSRNVDDLPLKARDQIELSLLLDQFPIGSRLLLKGFRRHGGFGTFVLSPTG